MEADALHHSSDDTVSHEQKQKLHKRHTRTHQTEGGLLIDKQTERSNQ